MMDGEDHRIALPERYDFRARLHPRPLLGDDELAPFEVSRRPRQQDRQLQREDMLTVQVLMQAVVVVGAVAKQ